MTPVCREGSADECAARAQLADRGLGPCWGGMSQVVAGPVKVSLWRDSSGIRLAGSGERAPDIEDVAIWLADKSRSPRYEGRNWMMLLKSESNVTHAFRAALDRGEVPAATLGQWRDRLSQWHRDNISASLALKRL